jgi:hypothetical protein
VRCCGSPYHQITVQTGKGALTLLRCTHCSDQRWAREGTLLERDQAFAQLATAYREVPVRARAARDRAAAITAARQAARIAQRAESQLAAPAVAEAAPDAARLMTMLDGWQVLGATA